MVLIGTNPHTVEQTGNSLEDMVSAYRTLGTIALRDFFDSNTIGTLAHEADKLLEQYRAGAIEENRTAYRPTISGAKTFERFDPVCDIAPAYEEIARDPRLMTLVEQLIGGNPFLLKDKLIYKLPHDKGYGLHQDYPYFFTEEAPTNKVVNIAIAIDSVSGDDGGLRFILDRHDRIQPAPQDNPKDCDPSALEGAPEWNADLGAGSVLAFHTLTPHSSGPNKTERTRRMLYLTYTVSSAGHLREEYYRFRVANKVGQLS